MKIVERVWTYPNDGRSESRCGTAAKGKDGAQAQIGSCPDKPPPWHPASMPACEQSECPLCPGCCFAKYGCQREGAQVLDKPCACCHLQLPGLPCLCRYRYAQPITKPLSSDTGCQVPICGMNFPRIPKSLCSTQVTETFPLSTYAGLHINLWKLDGRC